MARGRRGNGEGSICKRKDGRWMAQVTVGRRADGSLDRRTVYGKTRSEVAQALTKLKAESLEEGVRNPSHLILRDYLETWLANHQLFAGRDGRGLRANTIRIYSQAIRLHINPVMGSVLVRDLSPTISRSCTVRCARRRAFR